jgi:hypothetical protein
MPHPYFVCRMPSVLYHRFCGHCFSDRCLSGQEHLDLEFLVYRQSSTTYRPSSVIRHQSSFVYRQSSTTYRPSSVIRHQSSFVYRPIFVPLRFAIFFTQK